jgi:uncharacterized phiE125 gp8 family phage protein
MVGVISLADARRHCRIEADASADADLTGLIASAGREIERTCGMICPQRQVEFRLDRFSAQLRLPVWPIVSAEVHYLDPSGVEQPVPEVRLFEMHGVYRVAPAPGSRWPSTGCFPGAVRITAQAGFAAATDEAPSACPEDAQHAARLIVAHWFSDREGNELPGAVRLLLEPLRGGRC